MHGPSLSYLAIGMEPTVNGNVGFTAPTWCFAFGQRVLQQLPIGTIVWQMCYETDDRLSN